MPSDAPVPVGNSPDVDMSRLSSSQIKAAISDGVDTALIPMGAVEAHGPHLPIGTDTILATYVATEVARAVGSSLVAPAIPFGYAPRTRAIGTISTSVDANMAILDAYCSSLSAFGFSFVVFVPMHGEWFQTISLFAAELGGKYPEVSLVTGLDMSRFLEMRNMLGESYGVTPDEAGWHAGAAETSEMLAIAPGLVLGDQVIRGYLGPSGFGEMYPATLREGWYTLHSSGVMGDSTKASEEFGVAILQTLISMMSDRVRRAWSDA